MFCRRVPGDDADVGLRCIQTSEAKFIGIVA